MTEPLDAAHVALVDALKGIPDLAERYQEIKNSEARHADEMKQLKAEIVNHLREDRTWAQVGELLGVTGARAEQISRGAR